MDNDTIIRELGGGAASILVIILLSGYGVLALTLRALWARLNALQDKLLDTQVTCTKEVRDLQAATNTALGSVTTSLATLAAALNERRRNNE